MGLDVVEVVIQSEEVFAIEIPDADAEHIRTVSDLIESLAQLPNRGTLTSHDPKLRYLLYGNKPHLYRVLYRVDQKHRRIIIRHIRHGARRPQGFDIG